MSKAHYFVVVQTQEVSGPMLTVAPHQWVQGDNNNYSLMWPNKNAIQLSKNASSKPASTWTKMPCVVKRKFIPTYLEAEAEAADLSGISTDASDYVPKKKQKNNTKTQPDKGYDFNHMLNDQALSQPLLETTNNRKQSITPKAPTIISQVVIGKSAPRSDQPVTDQCSAQPVPVQIATSSGSGNPAPTNSPIIPQVINQDELSILNQSDINALLQNSQELGAALNQRAAPDPEFEDYVMNVEALMESDKIIQMISKKVEQECDRIAEAITSKFEALLVRTAAALKSDFDMKLEAALRVQGHNVANDPNFMFSAAVTVDEIQQLEINLAEKAYQDQFINHMQKIIGPNGDNCNGQNVSYALVDCFFNRKVMLECSWSGGSKTEVPKFAMKECKNILDVFFRIIHTVNPTFSKQLMEHFFKQILRNSKSRSLSKGLRQSTIHRRVKKNAKKTIPDADESTATQYLKEEALDLDDSDRQYGEGEDGDGEYDKESDEDHEVVDE